MQEKKKKKNGLPAFSLFPTMISKAFIPLSPYGVVIV